MASHLLVTIVGNRPQFIKMAPISAELAKRGHKEYIIHTGQHFDENMSGVFFKEMGIPEPDRSLTIHSRLHGGMTGEMLSRLEECLLELKPKGVLLYGDTNSTLAAALAAVKLHIPIAHVEAGPRIYDMRTPEEINRTVADHAAALCFCPDLVSVQNLAKENVTQGVYFTGDVMYDSFLLYSRRAAAESSILTDLGLENKRFALLTAHRPNNTDTLQSTSALFEIVRRSPLPVVFPMHPRTEGALTRFNLLDKLKNLPNTVLTPALGYLDMMRLVNAAEIVLTDSGGLQKEAFFAGKPTVILFFTTPWPQIEACGWQQTCWAEDRIDVDKAVRLIENYRPTRARPNLFGDGNAAAHIVDILEQYGWFKEPLD